jgi:hypothetical protein
VIGAAVTSGVGGGAAVIGAAVDGGVVASAAVTREPADQAIQSLVTYLLSTIAYLGRP